MKRIIALLCAAALLCCLCAACKWVKHDPPPPRLAPLLTLYTDRQPLRIVTQEKGVTVTLQKLEYEPTLYFLRPIADEWEGTLEPGKEYELDVELGETIPLYRLFIRQGERIAIHNLLPDMKDGNTVFEIKGGPWAPAPIDADSPMIHLCRTAAIVPEDDGDLYGYWYAIANAVATLRAVDLTLEPDELVPHAYDPDEHKGFYRVPEWLFEAYALALYPHMDIPPLGDYDLWVEYHPETHGPYWVGQEAYSDFYRGEYTGAKQNPDGTWDVTITVSGLYEETGEPEEKIVKLAPNEAYNPDSPFEYHIVEWPEFSYGDDGDVPTPGTPPPEIVVGTWKAPVKRGHVAYLEIFADGMAGLYLGGDESDQLYETYHGAVAPADDTDIEGSGVDYLMDMDFRLDWYIYESGDGSPITGVPDAYRGVYTLRHAWEGGQQVLYVTTNSGDNLYGLKELKMLWAQKTEGGGRMVDMEAMG